MTPAARVQTAIELLEPILAGAPAERVLTQWARASRFAGSKDRAAVRDHVYDVLRRRNSAAQQGGGVTPRALMIGLLRLQGVDLKEIFSGKPYAPAPLEESEIHAPSLEDTIDLPAWIVPAFEDALGESFSEIEVALKNRASVILRANLRKTTVKKSISALAEEGITAGSHPASETALIVTDGARKIRNSKPYRNGFVELQDAASQAAIDMLPLSEATKVLDYCAGGGGKLLAMAGRSKGQFFAHDANENRLKDLPERAKRAGVKARVLSSSDVAKAGAFDLVLCDVPCSGTGTWRRDPDAKWKLTPEQHQETQQIQRQILDRAQHLVGESGYLAYTTCSFLKGENQDQISDFISKSDGWTKVLERSWTPIEGCDGFYLALLKRD